MYEGYLAWGGVELANNARVMAYTTARSRKACGCPDLAAALGHDPYTDPATDQAPWFNPEEPESAGFGGLWVETIDGYYDAPYDLSTTQRLGDGAVVPRLRANGRILTITGWLYARDTCALDYGLRWLTATLAGCQGCDGQDLCLLRCCPTDADDVQRQLRTLKNAHLIHGPEVLTVAPLPAAAPDCPGTKPAMQVTFQLAADPQIWRQPVTVVDETVWPAPTGNELCNIEWDASGNCDPDNPNCIPGVNSPTLGCAVNPLCPPPPAPPRVPTANTGCACIPLYVVRQCADITSTQIPRQLTSALQVEIYSGDQDLHNVSVTVYQNPRQLPADQLDECRSCGTYYVEYIPAESLLTIDGTTSSTRLQCTGGAITRADALLFGDGGGPLQHTELRCGMHYTVCADMDAEHFSPLATLTVKRVTKEI